MGRVVTDIVYDFSTKLRLSGERGNANLCRAERRCFDKACDFVHPIDI